MFCVTSNVELMEISDFNLMEAAFTSDGILLIFVSELKMRKCGNLNNRIYLHTSFNWLITM